MCHVNVHLGGVIVRGGAGGVYRARPEGRRIVVVPNQLGHVRSGQSAVAARSGSPKVMINLVKVPKWL